MCLMIRFRFDFVVTAIFTLRFRARLTLRVLSQDKTDIKKFNISPKLNFKKNCSYCALALWGSVRKQRSVLT